MSEKVREEKESVYIRQRAIDRIERVKNWFGSVCQKRRFFILLISFIYLIIFEGGPGGQDPSLPQILKVRLTLAQSLMGEREREEKKKKQRTSFM